MRDTDRTLSAAGRTLRRFIRPTALAAGLLLAAAPAVRAGSVTFAYDAAGRLVSAEYDNGRFCDYRYDPAGNLLARTAGLELAGNAYPDEAVDLKDAVIVLQTVNAGRPAGATARGDVDGDQRLGPAEAVYILQTVANR